MSELRTNRIVPRDGLPAGATAGGLIQVVQVVSKNKFEYSTTNTWAGITGLSATITPTRSDSKVMIELAMNMGCPNNRHINLRMDRNGLPLAGANGDNTGVTNQQEVFYYFYSENAHGEEDQRHVTFKYIDSPATTSAVEYHPAVYIWGGQGSTTFYTNRANNNANQEYYGSSISTITLTELSG